MSVNITTYQNNEPITDIGEFANGDKQAKRGDKTVCLYESSYFEKLGGKTIFRDSLYGYPDKKNWWWHLDDGHLDVGPFYSEEQARIDCLESLGHHVKPLGYGGYRLTTGNYRIELESMDAVMDHLNEKVAA
jgi:hypothetical protein